MAAWKARLHSALRVWQLGRRHAAPGWNRPLRVATVLSCFAGLVGVIGCHSAPKAAVQPAEREEAQLELGPRWGSVYVARLGSAESPKLVLVHGLGQSGSRDFDALLPALGARFRV